MSLEGGAYNEQEKKQREKSEKEKKKELLKVVEAEKQKDKLRSKIEVSEELSKLKDMIGDDASSEEVLKVVDKVAAGQEIEQEDVEEVFNKIEEIEEIEDVDQFLPVELRVTKKEYTLSLKDPDVRQVTIVKINQALGHLANQVGGSTTAGLNLFSGYLSLLDKNLIRIQENTIEIKQSLESLNENIESEKNLSLWQRFVRLLKKIFL